MEDDPDVVSTSEDDGVINEEPVYKEEETDWSLQIASLSNELDRSRKEKGKLKLLFDAAEGKLEDSNARVLALTDNLANALQTLDQLKTEQAVLDRSHEEQGKLKLLLDAARGKLEDESMKSLYENKRLSELVDKLRNDYDDESMRQSKIIHKLKADQAKQELEHIKILEELKELHAMKPKAEEKAVSLVVKEVVPEIVVIVPYRDRAPQRFAFTRIMPHILEDKNYQIAFVHQRDKRPFNRGAMKNLGFYYVKQTYPEHYKDITIVFHDVDNLPWYKDQFSYQTTKGIINHFYGFTRALGGIFAIKGVDFEQVNGFPNIWTWGLEDNIMNLRCGKLGKHVIRPQFVSSEKDNKNIVGLWHGWDRLINTHIENKYKYDNGSDGIRSLSNIVYNVVPDGDNIVEVNVTAFSTGESLNSPFVSGAKMRHSRFHAKHNERFVVRAKQVKRGTAGTFGKRRRFGGMMMG